eukprot:scaffold4990_cov387-Prasinococcus_capsulatus_cf.AAC.13
MSSHREGWTVSGEARATGAQRSRGEMRNFLIFLEESDDAARGGGARSLGRWRRRHHPCQGSRNYPRLGTGCHKLGQSFPSLGAQHPRLPIGASYKRHFSNVSTREERLRGLFARAVRRGKRVPSKAF